MITTNHTSLRMSGALNIEHLTALKLHVGVNAHGWAIVEGEAGENALEQLSGALAGREQNILTLDETGAEQCLFAGVIREAELVRVGGYNRFHVELLSGTCLMDREVRSRSFQDVGRTYSQVAGQVCSEYSGGAAICTVGEDKTLGKPVIQYRETDWEFLMRMASHCGGVLVPETHRGLPRLWFGFPDRSFTCEFPEDTYTSGISQRYYELGGSAAGYSKTDFFYYDVESPQLCDLGWYTVFKGQPFIISEKSARLERGELIFTYRLGRPGLGWGKMLYNEKISGMTLLGEVLETSRETLKLKLDIDAGWNPGGPYPYTWRPETGNFMYCMPKVGTRVSLYCPSYDEKTAIAVNCVRTNGGDCDRMSDPAKRSFVTEHGKEMNLYPSEMSLVGKAMNNIWGNILVSDDEGVSIDSPKPIIVTAKEEVVMESSTVNAQAVNGEVLTVTCDPQTEIINASVMQSNEFDFNAALASIEGSNCIEHEPCNDVLKEADFELGKLALNVLAGLAVVAAVAVALTGVGAVLVAATAGAIAATTVSAAVTGAVIGGIVAVGVVAIGDCISGEVSDIKNYIFAGASGAVTGAIFSGANALKAFQALSTIGKSIALGGAGLISGGGNSIAYQMFVEGKALNDIAWDSVASSAIWAGVLSGGGYYAMTKISQLLNIITGKLMQYGPFNKLWNQFGRSIFARAAQKMSDGIQLFNDFIAKKIGQIANAMQSKIPFLGGASSSNIVTPTNVYSLTGEEHYRDFCELYGAENVEWVSKNSLTTGDMQRILTWDSGNTPSSDLYLKYKDVFQNELYFNQVTGTPNWPINEGFLDGTIDYVTVPDGTIFKRFGYPGGYYLGAATDPFELRALSPLSEGHNIHYYQALSDMEMKTGLIAPWFNFPGGGQQFLYTQNNNALRVTQVMQDGKLIDVTNYPYIEAAVISGFNSFVELIKDCGE